MNDWHQYMEEEHRAYMEWCQITLKEDKSYEAWLDELSNQTENGLMNTKEPMQSEEKVR